MKKTTRKFGESESQREPKAPVRKKEADSIAREPICDHDWQPDGQTMTAVRWTCTKCRKTKLNGLDI